MNLFVRHKREKSNVLSHSRGYESIVHMANREGNTSNFEPIEVANFIRVQRCATETKTNRALIHLLSSNYFNEITNRTAMGAMK